MRGGSLLRREGRSSADLHLLRFTLRRTHRCASLGMVAFLASFTNFVDASQALLLGLFLALHDHRAAALSLLSLRGGQDFNDLVDAQVVSARLVLDRGEISSVLLGGNRDALRQLGLNSTLLGGVALTYEFLPALSLEG